MIPDCTEETQAARSSEIDVGISLALSLYIYFGAESTVWKFIGVFQLMEGAIYNLLLHF